MINQYRRDTINKASSNQKTLAPKVIGRRQLLSTLALGSTALVGMVSFQKGAGVTGNGVHGTSVHDAMFSPAAAQETTTFTLANGALSLATFTVDSTGRITQVNTPEDSRALLYWQDGAMSSGLLFDGTNFRPYFYEVGDRILTRTRTEANPAIRDYLPNQIRPRTITSGEATLTVYPVTGRTGEPPATDPDPRPRVFVGFYAKHSALDTWQFIPRRFGMPEGIKLEVLVAVDGADNVETVEAFTIGNSRDVVEVNAAAQRPIPPEGLLAAGTADEVTALQAFDAALDAREIGTEGMANDENEYDLRRIFDFVDATTTSTEAPDPSGPTTSTIAPTTSTNVATTANATMAPTTTLVSTTMAGTTLVSTTLVSTTLVSPTIAGELSVRGAINAQGNIGANVARSLSGRLSSFRTRNRPRR